MIGLVKKLLVTDLTASHKVCSFTLRDFWKWALSSIGCVDG